MQTPGLSGVVSSTSFCFRQISPPPERTNHSSSTVRCTTAREARPAASSKHAMPPAPRRSKLCTLEPSGASTRSISARLIVAKTLTVFLRPCSDSPCSHRLPIHRILWLAQPHWSLPLTTAEFGAQRLALGLQHAADDLELRTRHLN